MPTTVQAVEDYLRDQARRVFAPAAALGRAVDGETVHQMRVQARRLRVGLRFFQSLFPAGELRQVLRQLRRLTRALGQVRTLDVNALVIRRAARQASRAGAGARVLAQLRADRARRLAEARELLALLLASQFPARVEALLRQARWPGERQLQRSAEAQLAKLRQALKKRARQYAREKTSRRFHQLRLAVKRYRYGLEAVRAVFGHRVRARLRAVEELQDVMGAGHDAAEAAAYLRALAAHKTLADELAPVLELLGGEQQKQMRAFAELMQEKQRWLKKVKWHG